MTEYKKVQSTVEPKALDVDEYSVWENSDVHEITITDENGSHTEYEFNQMQYTKDEYIKLLDEKNKEIEANLTDTQLALCEIFEMMEV